MDKEKEGKLFIVATPIGNLGDITLRAIDTLQKVDYILCEDTRVTKKILNKYEITTPLRSFYKEKEKREEDKVIKDLRNGFYVALVSDAGTPLINDPGYYLVKKVLSEGLALEYIPGASAVISAIVLSGFEPIPFTFLGYVPSKGKEREVFFRKLPFYEETVVFFETPHRITDTLQKLSTIIPERTIAVIREMTKANQQIIKGKIKEVLRKGVIEKGEITIVLEGAGEEKVDLGELEELREVFTNERELLSYLKWRTGLPRQTLYKWIKKL